jgi:hypothetical protein
MDDKKQINITGTNNRYMIKKVLKEPTQIKQLVKSESWNIPDDSFDHEKQIELILANESNPVNKIINQQIANKISGYKQQDTLKHIYDDEHFIDIEYITDKIRECELKCYYCKCEMYVLYNTARESNQWTVDRIDNDVGHNKNNIHIACLKCNLKRKRVDDDKFLFTRQLTIKRL